MSNMIKTKQLDTAGGLSVEGALTLPSRTPNRVLATNLSGEVLTSDFLKVDSTNNRLGIGTTYPLTTLDITGDTAGEAQVQIRQHNNDPDGPDLIFSRSRGIESNKTAVINGDAIGRVNAEAFDGTTYQTAGRYGWLATDNAGNTRFDLQTRVSGTTAERLGIDAAGAVRIAQAYSLPTTDGTEGQVLSTDGAGAVTWADSGDDVHGPAHHIDVSAFTADATLAAPQNKILEVVRLNTTASDLILTLPAISAVSEGLKITARVTSSGGIALSASSGDTINGSTANLEIFGGSKTLMATSSGWWEIASAY